MRESDAVPYLMGDNVDRGEEYERKHVHEVYEQIASHFSSTRYKVSGCSPDCSRTTS